MKLDLSFYDKKRSLKNSFALGLVGFLAILGSFPFLAVTFYVLMKGFSALDWAFITQLPKPPGEDGGGVGHAILGSFLIVSVASLIGIPWGLSIGIFMSEVKKKTPLFRILRFVLDVLVSVPSIVVGICVYVSVVVYMKAFSGFAGSLALSILMIPIIARSSEEIFKLIPDHIREAGLALGIPRWKVILKILLPGCKGALITGLMLAVARAAGETAPLLFTALSNQYWSADLTKPMASLPVQIYNFAISGFENHQRQAWAGSFVLVMFVMVLNLVTRFILRDKNHGSRN